jgi:hypothetical protein
MANQVQRGGGCFLEDVCKLAQAPVHDQCVTQTALSGRAEAWLLFLLGQL